MAVALVVIAGLLGLSQTVPGGMGMHAHAAIVRIDGNLQTDLQQKLMGKFHAMNDQREGIFHENITPTVAPYFPPGQPMAETKKIIAAQHLGALMPFKGKMMPDETAPYATEFRLTGAEYSQVAVVIHFDFKGDDTSNYVVKSVHAYLRGTSM